MNKGNLASNVFEPADQSDEIRILPGHVVDTAYSGETQDYWFRVEDSSWWFSYRAKVINMVADRFF